MEKIHALQVLSALSQPTRFDTYKLLLEALPDGLAAGDIARTVTATPNTMSAHLAILSRAGLVTSEKIGRSVIYKAEAARAQELHVFLGRTFG